MSGRPRGPAAIAAELSRLAVRDFLYEAVVSVSLILACGAALGPLLFLFGLKFGTIDTLFTRLVEDPRNREILPRWSALFSDEWLTRVRARPDVAFLVPQTRYTAAQVRLRNPRQPDRTSTDVELVPSGAGDPLLDELPPPAGYASVVLSAGAARKLGVGTGDAVEAMVARGGETTPVRRALRVIGVLGEARFTGDAALASVDLLLAVENYRDDVAVPELGWAGSRPAESNAGRRYPGFRLFARSVNDVPPLRDYLETSIEGERIDLITHAVEIERLQRLERTLDFVFWVVASAFGAGYLLLTGALLWLGVGRKKRELGILQLLGVPRWGGVLFPLIESWISGALGVAVAVAFFGAASAVINAHFADQLRPSERICTLQFAHLVVAFAATLASSLAAASFAMVRASRVDVSAALRES